MKLKKTDTEVSHLRERTNALILYQFFGQHQSDRGRNQSGDFIHFFSDKQSSDGGGASVKREKARESNKKMMRKR